MKLFFTFKLFIFYFLLLGICQVGFAQRVISGTVTEVDTKEQLPGAVIFEVGTTNGTATDKNGKYSLEVSENAKQISFQFVGFETKIVDIKLKKEINIELVPIPFDVCSISIKPEILLPFGALIENSKTVSAVSNTKPSDLILGGITDPIQLLQGKVAGLDISKSGSDPNGNFTARIRGLNTLVGNTEPLYVVDDVPNVPLQSVDVNDIESMTVLKDGSAAALYGARANGGVVLITTKRGVFV